MSKKYFLIFFLFFLVIEVIAQTTYEVTSVDHRYQLCDRLGINEWNGIEIDGNVVRIGHQTYYKDNKDEGYGYYGLSEAMYWDPIGSIRIGRNSATIRWMRMECPVKLITPEEKRRKQAEEDRRRALQREAKRLEDERRERERQRKIKIDKSQYFKIDKALKNKRYEEAVSLSSDLHFSNLYPNREGIKTALKEIEKQKDVFRVERIRKHISEGKIDLSISIYDSLSQPSTKEMLFDELNELFISVYSAIEHELNSNEIKSLISDNNTILKSLDIGSYLLKVESNGSNSGLPKSLNVTPHKYKKSDFSCSQGYSIPIEITIKEEKKEENVFSRKGGNVCMALIGKKRYRSNFWTRSNVWEKDCIETKEDINLTKKQLVYRGTYDSQKFANNFKIDENVITRDESEEVLNQRIPKIIWRAITLPVQAVYYILLYS